MGYCEECGAQIKEDSMKCPYCGAVQFSYLSSADDFFNSYKETPKQQTQPRTSSSAQKGTVSSSSMSFDSERTHQRIQKAATVSQKAVRNASNLVQEGIGKLGETAEKVAEKSEEYRKSLKSEDNEQNSSSSKKKIDQLVFSDDEIEIRKYRCSQSKHPPADGYLTVTNKRVIFSATSPDENSRIASEIQLDAVSGLYTSYGQNRDILKTLLFFIPLLIGIVLFFSNLNSRYGGTLLVFLGISLFIFGLLGIIKANHTTFSLRIYSSKAAGAPIDIGEGAISLKGNSALFAVDGWAAKDTDRMISELGAMIQDLQTKGDYAIEKWKE